MEVKGEPLLPPPKPFAAKLVTTLKKLFSPNFLVTIFKTLFSPNVWFFFFFVLSSFWEEKSCVSFKSSLTNLAVMSVVLQNVGDNNLDDEIR